MKNYFALLIMGFLSFAAAAAGQSKVLEKINTAKGFHKTKTTLERTYVSGCQRQNMDELQVHAVTKLKFSGNKYEFEMIQYSDPSCKEASIEVNESGRFTLKGSTLSTIVELQLWTPRSEALATGLALSGQCGFSDWKVGMPKSVNKAKDCSKISDTMAIRSLNAHDSRIEIIDCDVFARPTESTCRVTEFKIP